MSLTACPACRCLNSPQAQRCDACGAELGGWDTLPPPVLTFTKIDPTGAIWLDDLREPGGEQRRAGEDEEEPISLTLREIGLAPVPGTVAPPPAVEPVRSDAAVPRPPRSDAPANSAVDMPPLADDTGSRAARKAAKRAEVRRARLRGAAAVNGAASPSSEVLVIDSDSASREHLCGLLRAFGFGVHAVAERSLQAASRPIVAVFVDIAVDIASGGDGIDLCQQIRDADRRRGGSAAVLVLVAGQLRPIDRVRAELAGCDDTLLKPVTRGSVARVLDARGIALPSDARRL